jgi:hypothetical protein
MTDFDLDELIAHCPASEPNALTSRRGNPLAQFERGCAESAKARCPKGDSRDVYFILIRIVTRGIESLLTSAITQRLYC